MELTTIVSLFGGVAIFLFGLSLTGNGLKKAAGEKFKQVLYRLVDTPLKGMALGTVIAAIIQSSSATSVMAVGFVNSGMIKLTQAIGMILGANVGAGLSGFLFCLSYVGGESGAARILPVTIVFSLTAIMGILLYRLSKKASMKNIGSILLGFAVLVLGMRTMSGAMLSLSENAWFDDLRATLENPLLAMLLGILLAALLQSASASVGILQAFSVAGLLTFASSFPMIMGISVGAATPVLLSAVGTNKNAKRTALSHLLNNTIAMMLFSILFYGMNAFLHVPFLHTTMQPLPIAAINIVFRLLTALVLLPFTKYLEMLLCLLLPDDAEEESESEESDLLEERFLSYPTLGMEQGHAVMVGMAKKVRKNMNRAFVLLWDYSQNRYRKIQEKENVIDNYEDKLGTYLMQLAGTEPMEKQTQRLSILLHALSDLERLGDHAVHISYTAKEMYENDISFSDDASRELKVLEEAIREILQTTLTAFEHKDKNLAIDVEPLRDRIMALCGEAKARHVLRLRKGICEWKQGFPFHNLLTDFERIAAHCSNIAIAMIEADDATLEMHRYEKSMRQRKNERYVTMNHIYEERYKLPSIPKEKAGK